MNRLLTTPAACWQLLRLLALSRFRLKGRYWAWRRQTAFGRGLPETRSERLRTTLDYGRWIARMRNLGRPNH